MDRRADRRGDRAWLGEQWRTRGRLLWVSEAGSAPVRPGPALVFQAPATQEPPGDALLLGEDAEGVYWALSLGDNRQPGPLTPPEGGDWRPLRELGADLGDRDAGLLVTAVALAGWHGDSPRCPRCGSLTRVENSGWARRCPADGSQHFPRTDPAVIALVTSPDGSRAVLGRQPSWPPRRYSCLAGFVEAGESAEQAVAREVLEESGLHVWSVRPVASQPWPFPRSLMLGFFAFADPETLPRGVDAELEDVRWFGRDQVRDGGIVLPPPSSIASRLISAWLRG